MIRQKSRHYRTASESAPACRVNVDHHLYCYCDSVQLQLVDFYCNYSFISILTDSSSVLIYKPSEWAELHLRGYHGGLMWLQLLDGGR